MKTCRCGAPLEKLTDYGAYPGSLCRACYNARARWRKEEHRFYMREWMRTKRWLAGAEDSRLLGDAMPVMTIVRDDKLYGYISGERIF